MMDGAPQSPPRGFIRSRGMKFPKHPDIIRGKIRGALRENRYELREADAALRVVREGDRVMELGGGIGFMSTLVATHRKVEHVDVYEANPHLIGYINSVHEANGLTNTTVHNALLSDKPGTAAFHVRGNLLASSLDPKDGAGVTSTEKIEVRAVRDEMARLKTNVLICDIEGAEADLIPMMDLSNLRAAIIETHPQWIGPEGMNAVFGAFIAAGMAYYARGSAGKVVSFRRAWPLR